MSTEKRHWIYLGETCVDFKQVVKVVFNKDASLFSVAGDALILTAWTSDRIELSRLKNIATNESGWVTVRPEDDDEPDYAFGDDPEDETRPFSDQRVCLDLVDKVIEAKSSKTQAISLFSEGVFVGDVVGNHIEFAKETLGI